MRTGVFGGTFDPVHVGHIRAARRFIEECGLDELIVVPSGTPPHKSATDARLRYEMTRLAFSSEKNVTVSDVETRRAGVSYTFDTLCGLEKDGDELYLLCGSDMLMKFDGWHRSEDILRMCTLAVIVRDGRPEEKRAVTEKAHEIRKRGGKVVLICDGALSVSSTLVREKLSAGEDVGGCLSPEVYAFIKEKGLYK